MANTILNKLFVFLAAISLFSCSSDDDSSSSDNNDNTFVELPVDDLGMYEGNLFSVDPTFNSNNPDLIGGDKFVTISESSDKTYTIDYSNDIPSITDVQFIAAVGLDNVFTTVEEDLNSRGIAINIIDDTEGNRTLTVTNEIEGSTVVFTGELEQ